MLIFLFSLAQRADAAGFSGDDLRTTLLTLTTTGIIALLGLNWKLRDAVRDLRIIVGASEKKGSLVHRVDEHDDLLESIIRRNLGIDLVMRQYIRDMRRAPHGGGGQRAADTALHDAVELAFGFQPEQENP